MARPATVKKAPTLFHLMDLEAGSKCQVATIKSFGEMFEDFQAYEAMYELAGKSVSIQLQIGNIVFNSKNSGRNVAIAREEEDYVVGYVDHSTENNPLFSKNIEIIRLKKEWIKNPHEEIVPDIDRVARWM